MYKNKKIIAIIPARGGSKGLPGKNIKQLLGKPLIAWTIEQSKASKYIDTIFVSTDNEQIADVARTLGIDIPSLRPAHLAMDNSSSMDVILYTLHMFEEKGKHFDVVILLEPTSPLREVSDIDRSLEILISNKEAESIVSICKVEAQHPMFLVRLENKWLSPYLNINFNVQRRQEIEDLYFFEGSLYASYVNSLKLRKNFYHDKTLGYIVPKWKSFEVDDMIDLVIIEAILNARMNSIL